MAPKVEAFIEFNGDFKKVEAQWDRFFKSIENKDLFQTKAQKQSFNRYTHGYIKTIDDAYNKMNKKFSDIFNRMSSFVKKRMSMGAYGQFLDAEGNRDKDKENAFIRKRASQLSLGAMNRFIKRYEQQQEEQKKTKKDTWFEQAGAAAPSKYQTLKGQAKANESARQRLLKEAQRNEKSLLSEMQHTQKSIDKNMAIREKIRQRDEKERMRKEAKDRKNFYNALFMKWGKLGIAGLIAGQAVKYIVRGATAINQVAQTSLGHQMTIEGGASGGGFFGTGLAAMQRAGISAKEYGSWKRNMMGQVGGIKLGMGNAAPFMALGVSVLDNLDNMELDIEKKLQRLPAETSWALGSQMGMSYELWERMYRGEIDRSKPGYDEDAMKAWAEAAKNINSVLTDIKVFFYNTLGPLARLLTSGEGLASVATGGIGSSVFLPGMNPLRFAMDVSLKTTQDGAVKVDKVETQNTDSLMEINVTSI